MKIKVHSLLHQLKAHVINTNTKGAPPKYFGTSVPSPLRTKYQFFKTSCCWQGVTYMVLTAFQWQLVFKNWHFTTQLLQTEEPYQ
jgi:hypothetical protein